MNAIAEYFFENEGALTFLIVDSRQPKNIYTLQCFKSEGGENMNEHRKRIEQLKRLVKEKKFKEADKHISEFVAKELDFNNDLRSLMTAVKTYSDLFDKINGGWAAPANDYVAIELEKDIRDLDSAWSAVERMMMLIVKKI